MSDEEALAAFIAARQGEAKAVADDLFFACRRPDRVPDFGGAGGPAAEAFWGHFTPAYALAEIEHTRALVVRIRATPHQDTEDPYYACPQALLAKDWTFDGTDSACNCGRDDRVRGVLWVIASRWNGHLDYNPEWKP